MTFPSPRHDKAYEAMLAHHGSYAQRVEAGIDALRSDLYNCTKKARQAERILLTHSGVPNAQAEVPMPPTERCPGSIEMRKWLRQTMAETIAEWRKRGETQYRIHWYRPWLVAEKASRNWVQLAEWEPGAHPSMTRWPGRQTPFVIKIHERLGGMRFKKGERVDDRLENYQLRRKILELQGKAPPPPKEKTPEPEPRQMRLVKE